MTCITEAECPDCDETADCDGGYCCGDPAKCSATPCALEVACTANEDCESTYCCAGACAEAECT